MSDIVLNSNKKATCFTREINHVLQGYKELLNRTLPLKITKNHPKGDYILDKEGVFWYLPYPQTIASIENVINVMLDKYCMYYLFIGFKEQGLVHNSFYYFRRLVLISFIIDRFA